MPLSCDCYGGCWGDHSKDWPFITFSNDQKATEAFRTCHKVFEYGTYVRMGLTIRVETDNLKDTLQKALKL